MIWFWLGFLALVGAFLALDLGVFHRKSRVVTVTEALAWSAVWIATSLAFSAFIFVAYSHHWLGLGRAYPDVDPKLDIHQQIDGMTAWTKYVTGYVVEWSLSVDNIFVIALIFGYFKIPPKYQHRVLFWGILGAIVMRGGFILAGAKIIESFHWILYVFGLFLIFTAYKMLSADGDPDPSQSRVLRQLKRWFKVTDTIHGSRFIVYEGEIAAGEGKTTAADGAPAASTPTSGQDVGKPHSLDYATLTLGSRVLTPLALALVIVEITDLIFAVDSIPAIFGITQDSFLVFTSNIFAILGLRSMYFALAGLLEKFHLLKTALAIILGFVGLKMLFGGFVDGAIGHNTFSVLTLLIVVGLLAGGMIASLRYPKKQSADVPVA